MINRWFRDIASAVAGSVARPHETHPELGPPHDDLARFILEQHARMPDFLRWPMMLAAMGFDAVGIFRGGKPFHKLSPAQRERQLACWKGSKLSFKRDLVRYFESLATLALYSRGQWSSQNATRSSDLKAARTSSPECGPLGRFARLPENGLLSPALSSNPDRIGTGIGEGDKSDVSEPRGEGGESRFAANVIESPADEVSAEIVVIGSGPGGAITACILAEAGNEVLLIEEGPYLSLDSCTAFSQKEMVQKYRNGGQTVAMGKNKIAYVEGRCVGGGSEINAGLYHRTPGHILEVWRRDFEVEGLAEKDLQPHFECIERDLSVSALRDTVPAAGLKMQAGAARLGWKCIEVPRWFRYEEGADTGLPKGKRQSMTETYIPRFLRAGGRLLPRTRVLDLRQNGTKWLINARHPSGRPIQARADTVFLCAGAIQSPALLRRSGITNHIGNSLKVHPTVKLIVTFKEEVNFEDMGVTVHQVKEFSPRLSLGCSVSSPAFIALGLTDHPQAARLTPESWRRTAIYYAAITSEGYGSIRPLPGFRDPLVRYGLTTTDRRNLADGLRKLAQLFIETGATALYATVTGSAPLHCAGCLEKLPEVLPDQLANLMTLHLFSSCPMGENRARCATDSFGRVHGFKNLFVNDASLLCTSPGVNPQGSIMAVARRNARHFLQA